jgi:hypothetical protein
MRGTSATIISIGMAVSCVSSVAVAENPLGLYIGAGVGESDVRADTRIFSDDDRFDEHHTAWKAIAGIRPISPLAVELEYIDFGSPSGTPINSGLGGATGGRCKGRDGLRTRLPADTRPVSGYLWKAGSCTTAYDFDSNRADSGLPCWVESLPCAYAQSIELEHQFRLRRGSSVEDCQSGSSRRVRAHRCERRQPRYLFRGDDLDFLAPA